MTEREIRLTQEEIQLLTARRLNVLRLKMRRQPEYSNLKVGFYNPTKVARNGEQYAGSKIFGAYSDDGEWGLKCPYGQPGDRLRAGDMLLEITDIGAKYYEDINSWYWMLEVKRLEEE
jgi:hypothetical protein